MTRTFMEGMIERKKGHIVTISSLSALYPVPWYVVYSTTKAANCAFMRALHEQLRFDKHESYIKLTSVCPNIINTELTKTHRYR
jgi:all-trans-retinol dehydrogenase (NAD+)